MRTKKASTDGSARDEGCWVIAGGTLAADSVNSTAVNNTGPLAQQHFIATASVEAKMGSKKE